MLIAIGLCLIGLILTIYERSGTESEFGNLSTYGIIAVIVGLLLNSYAYNMKKKSQK